MDVLSCSNMLQLASTYLSSMLGTKEGPVHVSNKMLRRICGLWPTRAYCYAERRPECEIAPRKSVLGGIPHMPMFERLCTFEELKTFGGLHVH